MIGFLVGYNPNQLHLCAVVLPQRRSRLDPMRNFLIFFDVGETISIYRPCNNDY